MQPSAGAEHYPVTPGEKCVKESEDRHNSAKLGAMKRSNGQLKSVGLRKPLAAPHQGQGDRPKWQLWPTPPAGVSDGLVLMCGYQQ